MIRTEHQPGYVYCIVHHERGAVKIGYSKNPHRRLKQLQTGAVDRFTLFDYFTGSRSHEAAFHRAWKDRRIAGEWFDDQDHLISDVFGRMCWRERVAS